MAVASLIQTIQALDLPLPGEVGRREASKVGRRSPHLAEEWGAPKACSQAQYTHDQERKAHLSYSSIRSLHVPLPGLHLSHPPRASTSLRQAMPGRTAHLGR